MKTTAHILPVLLCLATATVVGCGSDRETTPAPRPSIGTPTDSAVEDETSGPLVVFLGDSITAGLHVDEDQAFPAVLGRKLAKAGNPIRIVNAGRSGDTSAGGLRRLDWLLAQEPRVVVVELGANDGLRGQPVEEIARNLEKIVLRIRERDALPVLLGMRIPNSYGEEYAEAFAALYEEVAERHDVKCIPFFMEGVAGIPELNHRDGIHPTAEGHRRLATNLVEPFTAITTEVTESSSP